MEQQLNLNSEMKTTNFTESTDEEILKKQIRLIQQVSGNGDATY
jgi:hypothetical protein